MNTDRHGWESSGAEQDSRKEFLTQKALGAQKNRKGRAGGTAGSHTESQRHGGGNIKLWDRPLHDPFTDIDHQVWPLLREQH